MGSFGFAPSKTKVQPRGTRCALLWDIRHRPARAVPPGTELVSSACKKWCSCPATGIASLSSAQNKTSLKGKADGTQGLNGFMCLGGRGAQHRWIPEVELPTILEVKKNIALKHSVGTGVGWTGDILLEPSQEGELSTRRLQREQAGAGRSPAAILWHHCKSHTISDPASG